MNEQRDLFPNLKTAERAIFSENGHGKPRLKRAVRNQVEMFMKSVDDLLPKDHLARDIWRYVEGLDLSMALRQILSVEGGGGRPATDPKILLALWLLGTVSSIGSARLLAQYCTEHDAFRWICGGVKVNYHTLSDFRSFQGQLLDDLLTQSVAILAKAGLISLDRASQDGMRVRACAGSSSFNREGTLQFNLELAGMFLADLNEEAKKNPGACKTRSEIAERRAAEEKVRNMNAAMAELEEVKKSKVRGNKTKENAEVKASQEKARASTTDPEARIMKMANGGFRPAYNFQFATTNIGKAIIGVDVVKSGSDQKQALSMIKQVQIRYGIVPKEWLMDGGYRNEDELEKIGRIYKNCTIYMPVKITKKNAHDPYTRLSTDSEISGEWRERMGTETAKEIYKERASTAEYVNAQARNRGLEQVLVKGLDKVRSVALLFAIVQNMMVWM